MAARRIAFVVTEPAESYRRGLQHAITEAGHRLDEPVDIFAWGVDAPGRVLLHSLRTEEDCGLLGDFCQAGLCVVALLPHPDLPAYRHALGHGAATAVDWNVRPDEIVANAVDAVRGRSVLPTFVVNALIGSEAPHPPVVTDEEHAILRLLASGFSVAQIADEIGHSERVMFRRLHELYLHLGVRSRSEALVVAERAGLLRTATTA